MTTITLSEFQELLHNSAWEHTEEVETLYTNEIPCDYTSDGYSGDTYTQVEGYGSLTSKFEDITITYSEGFNYTDCDSYSFESSWESIDDPVTIEGVTVVDDDGDEIDIYDLIDELFCDFTKIDYSGLEIDKTTEIDIDEGSSMDTYTLEVTNKPDLRFTGERIGVAGTSANNASAYYSGETGRWTELELYKTLSGKFICHKANFTQWQGDRNKYYGEVCGSIDEVIEFFGHSDVAKELYHSAKIDDALEVA